MISIHAPSRERRLPGGAYRFSVYFNPRSLTGATFSSSTYVIFVVRFQSTLPHGSDGAGNNIVDTYAKFQSTLPHGSDLLFVHIAHERIYFNPRSLTGATLLIIIRVREGQFQSTLPHGSDRPRGWRNQKRGYISIHAPSRERRNRIDIHHRRMNFNPRSLTGATGYNLFRSPTLEFQSTLPHGSDL